ncbi:hypothetical protein M2318_005333 [Metapseudomonas resinovorans]|uniref:hypothetical protein n=1 Tax=Metapseudomonas resinovorans TaxID=53412 RepID=UPI003D22E806
MFGLIVKGEVWAENHSTFSVGRILEFTEDRIRRQFLSNGRIDFDRLCSMPVIFAEELTPNKKQFALVGRVTKWRPGRRGEIVLDYYFDPICPPIPQADLTRLALELGIQLDYRGTNELTWTHWSVKDVDIFRILFSESRSRARLPKVFDLQDTGTLDVDQISAMMPFAGFSPTYAAIEAAATTVGMRCNRADNIWENNAIIQDIVDLIDRSAVVVCDCTGRNANVFYELGIAHTLGKEVILITQSGADIPFDVAHLRHLRYLNNGEGLQKLTADLVARLESLKCPSRY